MPINKPTYQNIVDRIRASIVSYLPDLDPTVYGSIIRAFADSLAGRSYDLVQLFSQLEKNLFPDTASGEFLERWAKYEGITRKESTKSQGGIIFVGNSGVIIPIDTSLNSKAGNQYNLLQEVILSEHIISVTSLTENGGIATAITENPHGYGTGLTVTISGATPTEYNGTFVVTALSETSFTYQVSAGLDDATGTILSTFTGGFGQVESDIFADDSETSLNLGNSSQLTLTSPIAGVDSTAFVDFSGITGALKQETDKDLLGRILSSRKNPVANFNVGQIEKVVLSITGNTRVKVKRVFPQVGAATILFVRDYDENIIPAAPQIAETRAAVLQYLPVASAEEDIYVEGPTPISVDFKFKKTPQIEPDTTTMRQAIIDTLQAFFTDEVSFEESLPENTYKGIIASTIDTHTGDRLVSFDLFAPTGDITIIDKQLAVLGDVVFDYE